MQLRHLRGESKQLGSELCDMQHDMICEERDLNVLHARLQQMNPQDPQYVCSICKYYCNLRQFYESYVMYKQ